MPQFDSLRLPARTLAAFALLTSLLTACERPGEARSTPPITTSTAKNKVSSTEFKALVEGVETLRDREFKSTPSLESVDSLSERRAGSEAYVRDRKALERALFGLDTSPALPAITESKIAAYDAPSHTIHYVAKTPEDDLERALILALVDALNTQAFAPFSDARSWDEALAHAAARRGDAALVWVTHKAADTSLDMATVTRRPEIAARLDAPLKRFQSEAREANAAGKLMRHEDAFIVREGFAFSAALWRSGGWSGAELARVTAPDSTAYIVRPDRWLDGEDLGSWTFDESENVLEKEGWTNRTKGRVGPGVLSLWIERHLDQARARSLFSSWQSDAYRFFERDNDWWFEWVSFWRTPSDATQIAGALSAVLNRESDAHFEVIESGATVSLVATSTEKPGLDLSSHAALNARLTPRYTSGTNPMLDFVPSSLDHYRSGLQEATLDTEAHTWVDPVLGLTLDLDLIHGWDLQQTDDATARWIARKDSATLLMTTNLIDPLKPAFESPEFAREVADNFMRSVRDATHELSRVDTPLEDSLDVRVRGAFEDEETAIHARIFKVGEVLVTFSMKGAPDEVDAHAETFETLINHFEIDHEDSNNEPSSGGIVEFEVEDN